MQFSRWNGDRKRRIALGHGDILHVVFNNGPDVVGATHKNDIGVPTNAPTWRLSAARSLIKRCGDADAGPRDREFAGRYIFQIWRGRGRASPPGARHPPEQPPPSPSRVCSFGVAPSTPHPA